MDYEERLFKALLNPDGYLWWEDNYPITTLTAVADDALKYNSIEGRIASLFIYHQINQEILNLLIRYCDLIIRASLYPVKISEETKKENLDFGVALKKLQASIEFKNKSKIISKSQQVNKLRNEFAHSLVKSHFNCAASNELISVQQKFQSIVDEWQEAMKWFYNEIDRLKERGEIQQELLKYKPTLSKNKQ